MKRATSGLHVFIYMLSSSFLATFDAVAPSYLKLIVFMKMVEFMKYETPVVEIIEVEVEKGFAVSPGSGNVEDPEAGGSI